MVFFFLAHLSSLQSGGQKLRFLLLAFCLAGTLGLQNAPPEHFAQRPRLKVHQIKPPFTGGFLFGAPFILIRAAQMICAAGAKKEHLRGKTSLERLPSDALYLTIDVFIGGEEIMDQYADSLEMRIN